MIKTKSPHIAVCSGGRCAGLMVSLRFLLLAPSWESCGPDDHFFAGTWDMMYSDRAVMVRLGLTPRLAGTTEPSAMYMLG